MNEYIIPEQYYFRIHHVRPRFKGDIENVLIFLAEELSKIEECDNREFAEKANKAIYKYPGNAIRELKTINNWRTEISSLFGFIEQHGKYSKAGYRALELAQKQDLVAFFKTFLFTFQYPGAHIKSHEILKQLQVGIRFKPAQYILKLLRYANKKEGKNIGLTKFEICHCVFNDLRCTRDNEDVSKTWERILENRNKKLTYNQSGDIVRYAGDIVDYMEIANLLVTYDSRTYYLNSLEEEAIVNFINSKEWFSDYDKYINKKDISLKDINSCRERWFSYVNRDLTTTDFSTDILAYLTKTQKGEEIILNRLKTELGDFRTKDIGDIGESLILGHECLRIKSGGREDLIPLIKRIPTQFAVGYDISSVELDERKRYIEVKTTISSKPLHFNRIHLTKNEWNTANSTKDRYFIYRLMISKNEKILFLLQDPVGLYKKDLIDMVPSDGAEITFNPKKVGSFEELLSWNI